LNDGQVLIAGGTAPDQETATGELYNPATGKFTPTGSMTEPRSGHTATLIAGGKVLIAGGAADDSAEIYDPASGTFKRTGSMTTARWNHTATLLHDGQVLIAGGMIDGDGYTASAELYDPGTGKFTQTGSMKHARANATATLLPDDRVLIAGGDQGQGGEGAPPARFLASAEIYDPQTGKFTQTASMADTRSQFAATLLRTGQVLVAGGYTADNQWGELATAELYDPGTGKWKLTGRMLTNMGDLTATLLDDGQVLLAGSSAELCDPATGRFIPTGPMIGGIDVDTATLLADGRVLLTGSANITPLAELYWP
jgi:hypothetical protein